jgi:GTPase SAR1 family protein
VIDSSARENIEVVKQNLNQLLGWDSLAEIPLLVLGNKNDIEGHLTEQELIEGLGLKDIKDRLVACYSISAKSQTNLDTVLKWLTNLNPGN